MEGGCRVVADILFLRVAAVLSRKRESVYVIPDFLLDSVRLDETLDLKYGGVVDYILAKYPRLGRSIWKASIARRAQC